MSYDSSSDSQDAPIRLVVGLGNPGREYAGTRHNVGFMIADRLAEKRRARWNSEKKWNVEVARAPDGVIFVKPQTFMNLSGEAVAGLCRFFKISPDSVLIVYDDVDLPLGRLRFRRSGSAGGHNGIKSIIQHLGTDQFRRLKFGIGRNDDPHGPMTGHVLGKFDSDETEAVEKSLAQAQDAVEYALASGLSAAMNRFNTDPVKAAKKKPTTDPKQIADPKSVIARENPGQNNQTQS
jgi:PTH1 family peptidyl-tRNA hydrolase